MSDTTYQDRAWEILRLVYGLVPLLAGLDKFFNVLTQWDQYLSPAVVQLLPVPAPVFLGVIGMVEIAVGAAVFSRWTKQAAYLAAAWLGVIALNLATTGTHFDVAVRDVAMAAGAYALAQLTAARETNKVRSHESPDPAEVILTHL
jgi:uncharacterized membrane protein YphA (DoxX/SURF4 family)